MQGSGFFCRYNFLFIFFIVTYCFSCFVYYNNKIFAYIPCIDLPQLYVRNIILIFTGTALYCCLVSLIWGATNPLIKKSTEGILRVKANNPVQRYFNEIKYLIGNWRYMLLFLINQLGSILYFILLQSVELSLIVPVINALTFIITAFVGLQVGENALNLRTYFGIIFILIGITFCVLEKIQVTDTLGE